jgi:hypothetical protein
MASPAPVLLDMMASWCSLGGQDFGIVGDGGHTYGFHRAANEVGPSDYSRRRDPNGSDGPFANWNWACAGDFAHVGNPGLRARHAEFLERLQQGDPGLRSVCEFIGQPYANQPVLYWCRWTGQVEEYTGSGHDRWSHISLWRSMADVAPEDPWRAPGGGSTTPPVLTVPGWPGRYFEYHDGWSARQRVHGSDVQQWQERMSLRGWSISVDGDYGPQSRNVCRQFQTEKGLDVDGIVGPNTWNAAWTCPVT